MNNRTKNLFRAGVLFLLAGAATGNAKEPLMLVNFGAGGGWYDPATNGQGFSFDIIPASNQVVAYWFTYPQEGGSREWYVAQGDISGNSVDLVIYQTDNGLFDQPSEIGLNAVGSALLEFDSCREAIFEYSFDTSGASGQMDLIRLGPTRFCEQFLAGASLDAVSHNNAWVNLGGDWKFEGCVQLDGSSSHGEERLVFIDNTLTLEIDNYNTPNCQGPIVLQILDFDLQRVDKTMALLEGEEVIANRYIMTDLVSGQEIRQLWYVDDRGESPMITHGVLDSPADMDGYPTELHSLFFARRVDS